MTEDLITRMYTLLDQLPQSEQVKIHEQECVHNAQLERSWHDFLVEQYLSGNLSEDWKSYVLEIPQVKEEIVFQKDLQKGIRTLQTNALRAEIRRILPKKPLDGNKTTGKNPRFYTLVISIAAIGLLAIGVLLTRLIPSSTNTDPDMAGIPVLMVEPFELEGVSEDEIIHGISQQLPLKLSVAEGIHPVTYYAVAHALDRFDANQVETKLHANYKVEGKIKRVKDGYRIQASLVDIEKNRALWKEFFPIETDLKAYDDAQDAITMRIINALNVNISPLAVSRMNREISTDNEALKLFLLGEQAWAERSEESLRDAIAFFRMALDRDRYSATIRGYLALAYETFVENGYGSDEDWARAILEAEKTLGMDAENPEALVVLGYYAYAVEKDFGKSEEYFKRALRQQPGDAKIHQAIAELHLRTGEIEIGKEHIQIARAIEPEHRVVRWVETKYLTATGQLEVAKEAAQDLLAMYPTYQNIQNFFWQYHLSRGEYQLALDTIPTSRPVDAQHYMQALTYLDQNNDPALDVVYQKLPDSYKPSIRLLWHVKDNEWEAARQLMRQLVAVRKFDLAALAQSSDFAILTKMKSDVEIQRILSEAGIKVHMIPVVDEPEI